MDIIKRDVDVWIDIFKRINKLKDIYGYGIVKDTLSFLRNINSFNESLLNYRDLLAVFWGYEITDIRAIVSFLEVIKDAYRYDVVIKELECFKIKYGEMMVAFIIDGVDNIKTIQINDNNEYYFAKDVLPFFNGDKLVFRDDRPFIVDGDERVLYTSDFNLGCDTLDVKQDKLRKKGLLFR